MKVKICLILVLALCQILPVSAQKSAKKIVITGKVVDADQNPLPGVIILVDNKNVNCQTDLKGCYKVRVSPSAKYITGFSMTNGMKDIPIDGKAVINIELISTNVSPLVEKKKRKRSQLTLVTGRQRKMISQKI